ncbi:MAG: hypothetical protein IJ461_00160 [Clostridia bacterium]|nr:hypothetical protein [Clostridia bacterium]
MKKSLALILCLSTILLCFPAPVLAESNENAVQFDVELASIFNRSANKWYSTEANRAMLSILLLLEAQQFEEVKNLGITIGDASYVGITDSIVGSLWEGDNDSVVIAFSPSEKRAVYTIFDGLASSLMSEFILEEVFEEFEKNDSSAVYDAFSELKELVGN